MDLEVIKMQRSSNACRNRSSANLGRHVSGGDGSRGLAVDVAALQHVRDAVVRHVDGAVAQALDQVLWVPRQPASKAPLLGEP